MNEDHNNNIIIAKVEWMACATEITTYGWSINNKLSLFIVIITQWQLSLIGCCCMQTSRNLHIMARILILDVGTPWPVNTLIGIIMCTGPGSTLSAANQVIITAVVCSLVFFALGMLVGALFLYWVIIRCACTSKQSSSSSHSTPLIICEDVSTYSHFQVKNDIELKENVAYGPIERVHP